MKILFNGYFYKNEKLKLIKAVKTFSEQFRISENFYFTLHSLGENESKDLNKKTFNKNTATDVLSFPLYNNINMINELNENMSEDMGDMFICRNVIKKNAKIYEKELIEELPVSYTHLRAHETN